MIFLYLITTYESYSEEEINDSEGTLFTKTFNDVVNKVMLKY